MQEIPKNLKLETVLHFGLTYTAENVICAWRVKNTLEEKLMVQIILGLYATVPKPKNL